MPGGRPKKELNQKQFEYLCGLQCTEAEICAFFDISEKTLTRWCNDTYEMSFSQVFAKKRELGKVSLRRSQMKLAEKNATMAIFLGKQMLGQTDKVEHTFFDPNKINDVNQMILESEAPERNIEDFESAGTV